VATVWTLAYGTHLEEAERLGRDPARLRTPPVAVVPERVRWISVFRRGLKVLIQLLPAGRWWHQLWLAPDPWPEPSDGLMLTIHGAT